MDLTREKTEIVYIHILQDDDCSGVTTVVVLLYVENVPWEKMVGPTFNRFKSLFFNNFFFEC